MFYIFLFMMVGVILIAFSETWVKAWLTVWRTPGVLLCLPLLLVSWLFFACGQQVLWCMSWFLLGMRIFLETLHTWGYPLSSVNGMLLAALVLGGLSALPTGFAWLTAKPFRAFKPPYWASIYVCIFLMVLVTLP